MSLVKIQGNASGTGTLTIAAPNTNTDYTLTLPASSGTLVLDGASQSPTFGTVTATALAVNGNNISAVNSLGFRNRIINGDMRIDQRNSGASVTPSTATYLVDRWVYNFTQASKFSFQQNAGSVTPPTGFTNYLGATVVSAVSIGADDVFVLRQRIEGFNVADLGWGTSNAQTVTLSFWVRSSLTGTFGGAFQNSAENRAYPVTYTINAANTWEQKTITVAGDTTGTWLTNNGNGIMLGFSLGTGATSSGTAGAWAASSFTSATGAVSVVGTLDATFYITGVQLEAGSVATPFERRDYGREFMMCQRFYETSYPAGYPAGYNFGEQYPWSTSKPNAVNFIASDDTATSISLRFVVQKRASPTVVIYSPNNGSSGFAWVYKGTGGAGNVAAGVTYTSESLWNISQGLSAVNQANEAYFHFTASAEL